MKTTPVEKYLADGEEERPADLEQQAEEVGKDNLLLKTYIKK